MRPSRQALWFPRLVRWKNWEISRPGREAVAGFVIVLTVSLLLHGFVLWLCSLFRR